jgi:hypothetical protein
MVSWAIQPFLTLDDVITMTSVSRALVAIALREMSPNYHQLLRFPLGLLRLYRDRTHGALNCHLFPNLRSLRFRTFENMQHLALMASMVCVTGAYLTDFRIESYDIGDYPSTESTALNTLYHLVRDMAIGTPFALSRFLGLNILIGESVPHDNFSWNNVFDFYLELQWSIRILVHSKLRFHKLITFVDGIVTVCSDADEVFQQMNNAFLDISHFGPNLVHLVLGTQMCRGAFRKMESLKFLWIGITDIDAEDDGANQHSFWTNEKLQRRAMFPCLRYACYQMGNTKLFLILLLNTISLRVLYLPYIGMRDSDWSWHLLLCILKSNVNLRVIKTHLLPEPSIQAAMLRVTANRPFRLFYDDSDTEFETGDHHFVDCCKLNNPYNLKWSGTSVEKMIVDMERLFCSCKLQK